MLATKAASPSLNSAATVGRLACTPNVSHGCVPLGTSIAIMPSRPIATSPRAAVYSAWRSLPPLAVQLPCGIRTLNESQPPPRYSTTMALKRGGVAVAPSSSSECAAAAAPPCATTGGRASPVRLCRLVAWNSGAAMKSCCATLSAAAAPCAAR